MEVVKDQGDEALYDKLDYAYPTDDEDDESEVSSLSLKPGTNTI